MSSIPEPYTPNRESPETSPPQSSGKTLLFKAALPLRLCGSLVVAVVLMAVLLVVLAWGTFIEAEYGTAVARFAVYDSLWFALLLLLLAINIFCSVLARFPWKPAHYPFVVAHFGILVLLVGCFFTWVGGEEAQISVLEGIAATRAIKTDRRQFEIEMISYTESNDKRNAKNPVKIPFAPGPFNWEDYEHKNWFHPGNRKSQESFWKGMLHKSLWTAMRWGGRDNGRLPLPSAASGVQIEVLDFHANSGTQPVAPMELSVLWQKPLQTVNELGEVRTTPRSWESVTLDPSRREHSGRGVQAQTAGGERINFIITDSTAEVAAFRAGNPDMSRNIGVWGQLVLHHEKKNYFFDVAQLIADPQDRKRVPLGDSGFSIGVVQFLPLAPGIRLAVYAPNGETDDLDLFADEPDRNVHAGKFGIFGTYWLDPDGLLKRTAGRTEFPALERMTAPRLDILQGPGKTLYYRFWTGRLLASSGEVLVNASETGKQKFTVALGTPDEAEFVVERFFSQDLPGRRIVAVPVGMNREGGQLQRVQLRVNVDGNEDIFWLQTDQDRYVYGKDRTVRITWQYDQCDLGFGIFLKRFEKRSEPGRDRMPSHYSSLVDFIQLKDPTGAAEGYTRSPDDFTVLQKDVLIRMNQPAAFLSPTLARRYWIYQHSYQGPFHPNDRIFKQMFDGNVFPWENKPRESLYLSVLSINADPGRGWKYLGCFLVVFGSLWLICRRR